MTTQAADLRKEELHEQSQSSEEGHDAPSH